MQVVELRHTACYSASDSLTFAEVVCCYLAGLISKKFKAEDLAMFFFMVPYWLVLLYGSFVYPSWDRLGLRVQVLCIGIAIGIGVIISLPASIKRFSSWLLLSDFRWYMPLLLGWLCLMWGVHGHSDLMGRDGLLSGFLCAISMPFLVYCSIFSRRLFWLRLLGLLLVIALLLDCAFLSMYRYFGFSFNDSFLFSGYNLPRMFLNTRDGNFLWLFPWWRLEYFGLEMMPAGCFGELRPSLDFLLHLFFSRVVFIMA